MQQEDEKKVAAAVAELVGLLSPTNANWNVDVDQALTLGAVAIILLLMRKWHSDSRSIQLHGCEVLASLIQFYHDKVANARFTAVAVSIIKSGGIETIMAAMKSFPDDDDIQSVGCNAIGNAIYYTDPTIDEAMARFVHKLNGIELVVPMMKKFQNNASVQDMGCHVLNCLSRKQVLHDALRKGGAISAVGEATEKHDDNGLQSHATGFFKNMFGNK